MGSNELTKYYQKKAKRGYRKSTAEVPKYFWRGKRI